jgi:putative SOS response-associated peptidase YedK
MKRCLVLADGFYEWKRTGQGKVPYRIALKTGEPFAFAGIWSLGQDAQRRPWSTFAILTTEANRLVAQLHNRMPGILQPQDEATWLNPEASPAQAQACLKPFPAHLLRITAVSPKVNSPASNTPDLLRYVAHAMPGSTPHGQEEASGTGLLFPEPAPA